MQNINQLFKSSPNIQDFQQLFFTSEVEKKLAEKLSPQLIEKIKARAQAISVYRFKYNSDGRFVIGYMLIPIDSENSPCIVYNRGGSMEFGALNQINVFIKAATIASWGYVVIASQYSGNEGGEGKDQFGGEDLNDVLNLKNIIDELSVAVMDVDRIGMYGGSRGGMMTLQALARADWIKAAVVKSPGGIDIVKEFELRPNLKKRIATMYDIDDENENLRRSAIYWVEKLPKCVPILLMHGTSDWRTPPDGSIRLAQRLYEEKVPFRLIIYEGADHQLSEFKNESMEQVRLWFDRYVKNREALPDLQPHGE